MIYLKIDNNKGYFIKDKTQPNSWTEIDKIDKIDLMTLLDYAVEEEFEMDTFDDSILANKSHQIIYKHLYDKFSTFLSNKSRFKDETEAIFKNELEKY